VRNSKIPCLVNFKLNREMMKNETDSSDIKLDFPRDNEDYL